jgi:hypothetical protein
MTSSRIDQIQGLSDLVHEAVAAGVTEVALAHQAIARMPFALLQQIGCIAPPVRLVERTHTAISDITFRSIHAINRLAHAATTQVIATFPTSDDSRADDP